MIVSIVTYHYVRPLQESRFPQIKGLDTAEFREQISYIQKHYSVISGQDLLLAQQAGELASLPSRSALLTFDDGYLDHFTHVFPILFDAGLPGCFFPPVRSAAERKLLDVNKIHFILASVKDEQVLIEDIFRTLSSLGYDQLVSERSDLWAKLGHASRYDTAEVAFIKSLLQRDLSPEVRGSVAQALFEKYVTNDETGFAEELYATTDQLRVMSEGGMYVGCHGYDHNWLGTLTPEAQQSDIEKALAWFQQFGGGASPWIMCYPYGSYDTSLLGLLAEAGCAIGLTSDAGIADLNRDQHMTLPRLDTNDLPRSAEAAPNEWTLRHVSA